MAGYWITISLGVSAWQPGDQSAETLIQKTDQALYAAKQQGRNRLCTAAASR